MQAPNRGKGQSWRGFSKNQQAQPICQRNVNLVQREIHPMIAGRTRTIVENCKVEQIGECGEGPVQSRRGADIPIPARQNGPDIRRRCLADPRIIPDHRSTIKYQRALKGIGVRNEDEAQNCEQPPVPPPHPFRTASRQASPGGRL